MHRRRWTILLAALGALAVAAPAQAGTYDVVSCGAPGAGGVNRAWQVSPGFDDAFYDIAPSCPELLACSERRAGVTAPYFTSAGFELVAPAGAVLDKMVIWRTGYRFNNSGTAQGPWRSQGYRADGAVIGGPFTGETCVIAAGQPLCRFGAEGAMAPGARVERDLETPRILYSVGCVEQPSCATANDQGFPFAGLSISGSIVTVRETTPPRVGAGGALVAPGWRTDDAPLAYSASDGVGISRVRVLVDGAEAEVVRPACDYHAMVPCAQQPARSLRFGSRLSDGRHTVSVEATDAAGNTNRVDRAVAVDRFGPVLTFVPSSGGRRIGVFADDPGAGVTGGTIEVRSRKAKRFRTLRTRLQRGRLVARLARGSRRGLTIRASATDAVGHRSSITGAPVRLRAGFGRRLRASTRTRLSQRLRVRGSLRADRARPARRAPIVALQRLRVDGARERQVAVVTTNAARALQPPAPGGREPHGADRLARRVAGLQAGLRRLHVRLPWSSSLTVAPRSIGPGGTVQLSGRLRLHGRKLPASGKLVELQAFDRGRWRVFASTRARGASARWKTAYRFGSRAGTYRIRARIRREGTLPFELGYSKPALVRVG